MAIDGADLENEIVFIFFTHTRIKTNAVFKVYDTTAKKGGTVLNEYNC